MLEAALLRLRLKLDFEVEGVGLAVRHGAVSGEGALWLADARFPVAVPPYGERARQAAPGVHIAMRRVQELCATVDEGRVQEHGD